MAQNKKTNILQKLKKFIPKKRSGQMALAGVLVLTLGGLAIFSGNVNFNKIFNLDADKTAQANAPVNGFGCGQYGSLGYGQECINPNLDTDSDGLPDSWEQEHFGCTTCAIPTAEPDGDGLTNIEEYILGTNPTNPDTDGDGANDGAEVANGNDPLNPSDKPTTNPNGGPNTDSDGLPDWWEQDFFGNLNQNATGDPDNDGLTNLEEYILGTNPNDSDSDNDGASDGVEVANGNDPLNPTNFPESILPVANPLNPTQPKFTTINITDANGTNLPAKTTSNFGNTYPGQRLRIEINGLEFATTPLQGQTCTAKLYNSSNTLINNAFAITDGATGTLTEVEGTVIPNGTNKFTCRWIGNLGSNLPVQNNLKARFIFN